MSHVNNIKISSKIYCKIREEHSKRVSKKMEQIQRTLVEKGNHRFLDGEISRKTQRKRIESGTHHMLGGEIVRKKVKDGTHNFLGGELQRKRIENGTHHLVGNVSCINKKGDYVSIPKEKYKEQTGPMEDWEFVHTTSKEGKRRSKGIIVDSTEHKFYGMVTCFDLQGNSVRVDKEVYYSQEGTMEEREFVAVGSKEGKRRKQKRSMT
jgi:hypothetical protein